MDGDIARWEEHWQKCRGGNKDLSASGPHRKYFSWLRRDFAGSLMDTNTLEMGAGRGTLSMFIALNGGRPTCIDTSATAKQIALSLFHKYRTGPLVYKVCDCLDYDEQKFPLVFSAGLMEHFRDPLPALNRSLLQCTNLAWHLVIGKTKGNDAFYRNDLPREWYSKQGWSVTDTDEQHIFIVSKGCERSASSS